jgi:predicted MFS family arabinose efflux permease
VANGAAAIRDPAMSVTFYVETKNSVSLKLSAPAAVHLLTALAYVGIPLGSVLAGVFVDEVGLVPTILGMGAIYLAVTLSMFFNPALRKMEVGRKR